MEHGRQKAEAGFTLIEVMVVIVIIMILAGIVVGAAKYAQMKGARSRAQAEIAMMETALENYKNDNGIYPITPPGRPPDAGAPTYANSPVLYAALTNKAYMTLKPNQIMTKGSVSYIVDPFGSPYSYYCPQHPQPDQTNSVSFDLWSYGPNNKNDEGTNDDIANWKQN